MRCGEKTVRNPATAGPFRARIVEQLWCSGTEHTGALSAIIPNVIRPRHLVNTFAGSSRQMSMTSRALCTHTERSATVSISTEGSETPTFGARLAQIASESSKEIALVFAAIDGAETLVTWEELDARSNQLARLLAERGVTSTSTVVAGVWNCPEHILLTIAAWKVGALVLPLRAILPARERDQILELATPGVVFADWADESYPRLSQSDIDGLSAYSDAPLEANPEHPGKAIASGGSTGRSKIIVDRKWHPCTPMTGQRGTGSRPGQVQLLAAPLYHNSPFLSTYSGLANRHTIVMMEKFDAAHAVDLIERHRVNYAYFPPIIMRRIALLPDIAERDLSSIEAIQSSAAPCPDWLKRFWIDLIGAEKVYEVYGSTEGIGATMIRGDDWLEHPGSVGRPVRCEMKILDESGNELPSGDVGEIFMRPIDGRVSTFEYIGAPDAKSTPDGFKSISDLGWVDDDGFLYIADRRVDLIVSGGANVYPAEVEAALSEHPDLEDVAVIGVPDEEWGRRVHAIIQVPAEPVTVTAADLDRHCRERLTSYKVPKTYEFVRELPRNEAGKIRRSALVTERESGWIEGMVLARGES
jgi:bile acid-coenzyme A ligase